MLNLSYYLLAWSIYLLAALGLSGIVWHATRNIRHEALKKFLRILLVCALFVPWVARPDTTYLCPAIVILMFEGFTGGWLGLLRGGVPILLALIIASLFLIFDFFVAKSEPERQKSS